MIVGVEELMEMLRISRNFRLGDTLSASFQTEPLSMTVSWTDRGIHADLSEEIEGESSVGIITIDCMPIGEGYFEVAAMDRRADATDDPQVTIAAFGAIWTQLHDHGL